MTKNIDKDFPLAYNNHKWMRKAMIVFLRPAVVFSAGGEAGEKA
ncbi:MAG: hypothetical protein PUC00_12200 [Clostridiales bacterium]|nr:hypothetical protein [Clostridiales bacterium]